MKIKGSAANTFMASLRVSTSKTLEEALGGSSKDSPYGRAVVKAWKELHGDER